MTINERLKFARKEMKLNQTTFGEKIGVSQTAIGQYENGSRTITDRVILQICQTFQLSENWFRTGDGEMFIDNSNTILSQLASQYDLNSRSSALVECFLSLSGEQRDTIVDAVEAAAEKIKAASTADDATKKDKDTNSTKDDADWKKRELEDYAMELEAQEGVQPAYTTMPVTEKKA